MGTAAARRTGPAGKSAWLDGWAATRDAWLALFPLVVLVRSCLHGWLAIRSRGQLSVLASASRGGFRR